MRIDDNSPCRGDSTRTLLRLHYEGIVTTRMRIHVTHCTALYIPVSRHTFSYVKILVSCFTINTKMHDSSCVQDGSLFFM